MRLPQFFSNPWVGVIATASSIISIPLSFLLYWDSIKERDLTYYVHPVRTVVLHSGYGSGLRVLHNEQEIKTDVTAVQIAIWNKGKEPILKNDIVVPMKLTTRPPVRILEATIVKRSRDATEFALENSALHQGLVPISWRLLERTDGAIVQLLYAGRASEVSVELEGAVLGQKKIDPLPPPEIENPSGRSVKSKTRILFTAIFYWGWTICFAVIMMISRRPILTEKNSWIDFGVRSLLLLGFFLIALLESNNWLTFPEPPFGF